MEEELTIQEKLNKIELLINHNPALEKKEFVSFQIFEEMKNEQTINVPGYGDVLILKKEQLNRYKSEIKKFEGKVNEILPKVERINQNLTAKQKEFQLVSSEKAFYKKEFEAQKKKIENIFPKEDIPVAPFQFPQALFFINSNTTNIFSNAMNNNVKNDSEIDILRREVEGLRIKLKESLEKEEQLSTHIITKSNITINLQKQNEELKVSLQMTKQELETSKNIVSHLQKNLSEKDEYNGKIMELIDLKLKEAKIDIFGSQKKWTENILNLGQNQDQVDFPYFTETQARLQLKIENELLRERLFNLERELSTEKSNNQELKTDFKLKIQEFEAIKENILKNLENSVISIEKETIQKIDDWVNQNEDAYAAKEKLKELQEKLNQANEEYLGLMESMEEQKKVNIELKLKLDIEIEEIARLYNNFNTLEQQKSNLEKLLYNLKISKEEEIYQLNDDLEELRKKNDKLKKECLEISSEIELLNLRRQKIGEEESASGKLYLLYKDKYENSEYENLLLKNEVKALKRKIRIENRAYFGSLKDNNFAEEFNNNEHMNITKNFKDTENFLGGLLQRNKSLQEEMSRMVRELEKAEKERELNKELALVEGLEKLKNLNSIKKILI